MALGIVVDWVSCWRSQRSDSTGKEEEEAKEEVVQSTVRTVAVGGGEVPPRRLLYSGYRELGSVGTLAALGTC